MSTRKAAVAGMFYESDRYRLRAQVDSLLAGATSQLESTPDALIVPHAGYIYSGATAAKAYTSLVARRDEIQRVVLLGPAHRVYLNGMAVPSVNSFATPFGEVELDRKTIDRITVKHGVITSDEAHRQEHCLEVQLPFLQSILGDFSLVPILVGDCKADIVAALIDELWGGPETLLVVSSDLSHFHSYDEARQIDASTCGLILDKFTHLTGEQACGAHAINGLMCAKHCKPLTVEMLDACNSGDTAGSKDRVVGYGAFILH